jgi:hypothetical protein
MIPPRLLPATLPIGRRLRRSWDYLLVDLSSIAETYLEMVVLDLSACIASRFFVSSLIRIVNVVFAIVNTSYSYTILFVKHQMKIFTIYF